MTVKMKQKSLFHISDIQITNLAISWENYTLRVPAITRIWVGNMPTRLVPAEILLILLFITLSSPRPVPFFAMAVFLTVITAMQFHPARPAKDELLVNIELDSGKSLSFLAYEEASAKQFYDTLKLAMNGAIESKITFDSNGAIETVSEEPVVYTPVPAPEPTSSLTDISEKELQQTPLLGELQALYQSITKKTDANSELLNLIDITGQHAKTGNQEGLRQVFEQFVTLGLIGNCNELGLECLIREIKQSLY